MRFQVPQFVDIEDKIVGPFTLKQFLIYLGGVFVLIPAFLSFDLALFITVALPVAGITVLFAHFRFHGKSLFALITSSLQFASRGQLFTWQRTSTPKFLTVAGPEYADFSSPLEATGVPSLQTRAQALETAGNISQEDAEDPLEDKE